MPSQRYTQLRLQVRKLERSLLPTSADLANLSIDITKASGVEDRAAAFLVLCHAEFESYLEDRSRSIAQRGESLWLTKRRITPCAFALMAFYGKAHIPTGIPVVGDAHYKTCDLSPVLQEAVAAHIKRIEGNNGIKSKDLTALIMPIGMRIASVPGSAVAELDTYGSQRGKIAHQANGVRASLNARDEQQRAGRVLTELLVLDMAMSKLTS